MSASRICLVCGRWWAAPEALYGASWIRGIAVPNDANIIAKFHWYTPNSFACVAAQSPGEPPDLLTASLPPPYRHLTATLPPRCGRARASGRSWDQTHQWPEANDVQTLNDTMAAVAAWGGKHGIPLWMNE